MKVNNLFIVFLFLSNFLFAQSPKIFFDQGNKAYNLGDYDEAVTQYHEVLKAGFHSSELYFNLANAYYRLGVVGESIFYFEKAKQLDPKNKEILTNLSFAQNMTLDAIEVLPESIFSQIINRILSWFTMTQWAKILISFAWLLALLFVLYLWNTKGVWKRVYFSSFWILTLVFISIFTLTYLRNIELESELSGIVFESKINIWGEPNDRSEILFVLHEGTKVEVLDELAQWKKIKIANGSEGWILESSLRMLN
ncbi:MAG: ion channel protein [Flavobacteriales bacterium]|nr:ion channel protein [Candidatus Arcticimaribacter sp.]